MPHTVETSTPTTCDTHLCLWMRKYRCCVEPCKGRSLIASQVYRNLYIRFLDQTIVQNMLSDVHVGDVCYRCICLISTLFKLRIRKALLVWIFKDRDACEFFTFLMVLCLITALFDFNVVPLKTAEAQGRNWWRIWINSEVIWRTVDQDWPLVVVFKGNDCHYEWLVVTSRIRTNYKEPHLTLGPWKSFWSPM